jgi:hypothetical protein
MKKLKVTLIFLGATLLFAIGCKNDSKIDSYNLASKSENILELEKHVKFFSEVNSVDYELFNVNGFENKRLSAPGASSMDYKIAVQVNKENLDSWVSGMVNLKQPHGDLDWIDRIKEKGNWNVNSTPEYYERKGENVKVIMYRDEGVIFKRIINE